MKYTMVTVIGDLKKPEELSFMLLDDEFGLLKANYLDTVSLIKAGSIINLKLSAGKIVGEGGALDRYTNIDFNGNIVNNGYVILQAIEANNKRVGFTVFTPLGVVKKLKYQDVVKIGLNGQLANGKIRKDGEEFVVSAIYGEYKKQVLEMPKKVGENTAIVDVPFDLDIIYIKKDKDWFSDTCIVGAIVKSQSLDVLGMVAEFLERDFKVTEAEIKSKRTANSIIYKGLALKQSNAGGVYVTLTLDMFKQYVAKAKKVYYDPYAVVCGCEDIREEEYLETTAVIERNKNIKVIHKGNGESLQVLKDYISEIKKLEK